MDINVDMLSQIKEVEGRGRGRGSGAERGSEWCRIMEAESENKMGETGDEKKPLLHVY